MGCSRRIAAAWLRFIFERSPFENTLAASVLNLNPPRVLKTISRIAKLFDDLIFFTHGRRLRSYFTVRNRQELAYRNPNRFGKNVRKSVFFKLYLNLFFRFN